MKDKCGLSHPKAGISKATQDKINRKIAVREEYMKDLFLSFNFFTRIIPMARTIMKMMMFMRKCIPYRENIG